MFDIEAYIVDAVLGQPVETLEEEKHREERDKSRTEVISKDGERQTRLCDSIPRPLNQMLQVAKKKTFTWMTPCNSN